MGLFDNDPKYQKLKNIRESGYKGWLDQDLKKVKNPRKWAKKQQRRNGR